MTGLPTVRAWWHGRPLSLYEKVSISSFLSHGHPVEIYSYEPLDLPKGALLVDANLSVPKEWLFSYKEGPARGSYMAASNLIRFEILNRVGGIWSDLDVLCLRPFSDLPANWIMDDYSPPVMALQPGEITQKMLARLRGIGADLKLGQTAELLREIAQQYPEEISVLPWALFKPIPWAEAWTLISPELAPEVTRLVENSYCLHWWGSAFQYGLRLPLDKLPPSGSYFYEAATNILNCRSIPAMDLGLANALCEDFRASLIKQRT